MNTQISYGKAHTEMDRIEAECGCELPALNEPTLAARAQRVLNCDDPPKGDDEAFCLRILGGNVIAY